MDNRKEVMKKYNSKPDVKARKRAWYIKNRERMIKNASERQKHNPNRKSNALRYHYKKYFGFTDIPDKGECFICGSDEKIHIHHIDGNNGRNGRELNNHFSNLVSLCVSCHARLHHLCRRG